MHLFQGLIHDGHGKKQFSFKEESYTVRNMNQKEKLIHHGISLTSNTPTKKQMYLHVYMKK